MSTKTSPSVIYGAGSIGLVPTPQAQETLNQLKKHNIKAIDTARRYPNSEAALGQQDAPKTIAIHTKAPTFEPGSMSKQSVLNGMEESLKDLGVDSVDLYYLHAPDNTTPIEETLSAIQELYAAGKFKRFGISNYMPADVQRIYDIQSEAKSVLPTVYQGNYNAVARHIEESLFPLLRKLNISFYAYSPIAGGFLCKTPEQVRDYSAEGRFGGKTFIGDFYNRLYGKDTLYEALGEWEQIAAEAGITKAALAYRWILWHSKLDGALGDGIIFGARTLEQLEETLVATEAGPLEDTTAEKIENIWKKVEAEAPKVELTWVKDE